MEMCGIARYCGGSGLGSLRREDGRGRGTELEEMTAEELAKGEMGGS